MLKRIFILTLCISMLLSLCLVSCRTQSDQPADTEETGRDTEPNDTTATVTPETEIPEFMTNEEETTMETILKIEGMMCPHCQARVEKALTAVAGVETVTVDLAAKTAAVTGSADPAVLKAAVIDAGYEVV